MIIVKEATFEKKSVPTDDKCVNFRLLPRGIVPALDLVHDAEELTTEMPHLTLEIKGVLSDGNVGGYKTFTAD